MTNVGVFLFNGSLRTLTLNAMEHYYCSHAISQTVAQHNFPNNEAIPFLVERLHSDTYDSLGASVNHIFTESECVYRKYTRSCKIIGVVEATLEELKSNRHGQADNRNGTGGAESAL